MNVIEPNAMADRMARLILPKIYCNKIGFIVSRFIAVSNNGIAALLIQNLPQTRLRNNMSGIIGGMLILANKITSGLFNLNKNARAIAATN